MSTDMARSSTLAEVIAIHAAALGRPSIIYCAGGILTAAQWAGHATATRRTGPRGCACRLYRQSITLQRTAEVYGSAGEIVGVHEVVA